ncbi:hypothetical protein DXG03_003054 [Asterophora parasitica]|uniref:Uncharacterized protein n=1 Tax=Asterophora parasitica TaxID=117018 RepID=A0A9P7G7U1_9AGAR|nr:hypothetical protein DXG03_003054 [Asterophora parasitica]
MAEHDPLDILSATDPASFYASTNSSSGAKAGPRRSLRPRQSLPAAEPKSKQRKRTLSTSAAKDAFPKSAAKKLKSDEKKAVGVANLIIVRIIDVFFWAVQNTDAVNQKRDVRNNARKRWLYCHRDVVEPLLAPNSMFYDQLQKEVERNSKGAASFIPTRALDEQPKLIQAGQMKDYQLEGLSFLVAMYKNGVNCILGDEYVPHESLLSPHTQGSLCLQDGTWQNSAGMITLRLSMIILDDLPAVLVQTLSLFAYIKENIPGPHDPHLVICPLSVLSSWEAEAARWVPSMHVIRLHGPANERDRLKQTLRGKRDFDIMFTTYETYVAEDQWFKSFRWTYCVLDEGHKIKNSDTLISSKIQGLGSLYRLLLTGTPVQNNLLELWGLLHWLLPAVFTLASQSLFKDSFDITRGSYTISFLNAAKTLVSKIMLRRTKATVAGDDVPPREELTVFIPLTEAQRFWTYRLLTKMDTPDLKKIFADTNGATGQGRDVLAPLDNQNNAGSAEGSQWKKLMNLLMQLRKVCDHPYLLPSAEPEPYEIGEHVVTSSSKLIAIDKILADILPKGERVLIFSQWTGMLDLLEDFMNLRSIPYARLDGSTPRPRRALNIRLFQQEASPFKVFLISTKAGGLGINLTKATTVIMCDSDWNPQNDLQAIARAHRIGQTKVVKVYRLICQGSVEDQMLDRIRRKLFLSVKIMGSDNPTSSDGTSLGSNELMDILRKGSSALSHSDDGMNLARFLVSRMADILEHSRSLESKRDAKIQKNLVKSNSTDAGVHSDDQQQEQLALAAEEEERRLLSGVAQVQSRLFEGQLVNKYQSNAEIAQEWRNLEKRSHVDRSVKIDGMTFVVSSIPERVCPFFSSGWFGTNTGWT